MNSLTWILFLLYMLYMKKKDCWWENFSHKNFLWNWKLKKKFKYIISFWKIFTRKKIFFPQAIVVWENRILVRSFWPTMIIHGKCQEHLEFLLFKFELNQLSITIYLLFESNGLPSSARCDVLCSKVNWSCNILNA